jgi:phosphate transport system substrate-binding protein
MKRVLASLSVFSLLVSVPAAFAAKDGSIQVKGSDTMVNLVQGWAEKYTEKDPEAFIAVTGGGSGTGLAALINGTADIAVSSREIKTQEKELAAKKGVEAREIQVALDGLAVVVHPSNPVSNLSMDQLADIFSGKITDWKDAGGEPGRIVLLSREVNSGTHVYFKEHVLRKGDSKDPVEFAPDALLLPSSQAIADEVKNNKNAIGYYGMGYISPEHKAVNVSKDAVSAPVPPTEEHVIAGDYPISRPLYFYVNGEGSPELQKFLEYIMSAEGQTIVSEMDFVPVKK